MRESPLFPNSLLLPALAGHLFEVWQDEALSQLLF